MSNRLKIWTTEACHEHKTQTLAVHTYTHAHTHTALNTFPCDLKSSVDIFYISVVIAEKDSYCLFFFYDLQCGVTFFSRSFKNVQENCQYVFLQLVTNQNDLSTNGVINGVNGILESFLFAGTGYEG